MMHHGEACQQQGDVDMHRMPCGVRDNGRRERLAVRIGSSLVQGCPAPSPPISSTGFSPWPRGAGTAILPFHADRSWLRLTRTLRARVSEAPPHGWFRRA